MDVLIPPCGRVFVDLIFSGLKELPHLGEEHYAPRFDLTLGGVYNVARALHRLGIDAHLWAYVGTDRLSRIVRELWDEDGLPADFRREVDAPCGAVTCSFSMDADRAFLSHLDPPLAHDVDVRVLEDHRVRHVLLPGIPRDESLVPLIEAAHARGIPVFMDCQFTKRTLEEPVLRRFLALVDVFFANELEARTLSGADTSDDAARRLAQHVPVAVVKLGRDGALLARGGEVVHRRAPAVSVVDTTGAGDCFMAGYVYGLVRGRSHAESLRLAIAAGSLACTGPGGAAAPTERELVDFLPRVP